MSTTKLLFLILNIVCISFPYSMLGYDTQYIGDRQEPTTFTKEVMQSEFARHIWTWTTQRSTIGQHELTYFVKNIYNSPLYNDYLPNTFGDLIRFLTYGNSSHRGRTYMQQVLRLFSNKLKGCHYVHATAFSQLLDELPSLLERHFLIPKIFPTDEVQRQVSLVVQKHLKDVRKDHTMAPVDALTQDILASIEASAPLAELTSIADLRKTTLLFLEICLSKLIWSPEDNIDTWHATKKVSHQLATLLEHNIVDDPDDLNDIFISLLERYCFFIDLMAEDLHPTFYASVKDDMAVSLPVFLDFEEQEPSIEHKVDRFKRTLTQAEPISQKAFTHRQLQNNVQHLAQEHKVALGKPKQKSA